MRINGLVVDPRLAALMQRSDWRGKRTSEAWLSRFPVHAQSKEARVPFVQFISPGAAISESKGLTKPGLEMLLGTPDKEYAPGDIDPTAAYIIGFVDYVDSAICVDVRPASGPRITYDNFGPRTTHATAFDTIDEFVQFFIEQHGDASSA